ncbi:Flp pilus assembly protein CpaB [Devosia sp. XJ19-1]|uniref:Flp pilus assembly protein CpaB n=1 Tax=Devosia ureilytica TaxID=2952754 RepID=A0A9Q4AP80_9HYPH|nr:Flp pilus assembly protein CpaB [Devosia ureilytica]MCP8883583.1 Flp pilus assembly protein CpaB [Devosia ureilytica]MCP8887191.1 Flp pilus assembly protein CpaB [Devosia ureilytica]
MRIGTILMLTLAVAFGVGAVFLSSIILQNRQPIAAAVATDVEAEDTIVVAAVPLRFGDRLTEENVREIPWTASVLPAGSFRSRTELTEAEEGERQVLTAIEANEPILNWKITGAGQRATLSAVLADGMRAISIRVNDVLGVAGFVLPGDRVDIMLTREQNDESFVDVLLQGVKVLAIDQSANDREENPTVVKTVTLEVATVEAQKLVLAAGIGQLSLALREAANGDQETTRRISLTDLNGEPAGEPVETLLVEEELTEVEANVKEVVPSMASALPSVVSVGVTRGVVRDTYDVPIFSR